MHTSDEIRAMFPPPVAKPSYDGNTDLPFWVVVVNPRRNPVVPKFHSGHVTLESANTAVAALQDDADEEAKIETARRQALVTPLPDFDAYRYFVLKRPNDDTCRREFNLPIPEREGGAV